MECRVCHVVYDPEANGDWHRRCHDEFVNGVKAKPLRYEHVVYCKDDFRIVLVTPISSRAQRIRAQKVAQRANRETRYDGGIYSALAPFGDVFLGHLEDRAIALLVLARSSPVWHFTWEMRDQGKDPELISEAARWWTVDFVWVLPQYRGQGLANRLLNSASARAELPLHKLAWRSPFSESGESLVRRHCPDTFLVA